jgi:hypothetical protein
MQRVAWGRVSSIIVVAFGLAAAITFRESLLATLGLEDTEPSEGVPPDPTIVRPELGTLVITPQALTSGQKYWLYINKDLIQAPPEAQPRPTVRDKVEGDLSYDITLMTLGLTGKWFPFVFATTHVFVQNGATTTVSIAPQPGTAGAAEDQGFAAEPRCNSSLVEFVNDRRRSYLADPGVKALYDVLASFVTNKPLFSSQYIDFPDELGGPRQYNADQVDILINAVDNKYQIHVSDEFKGLCATQLANGTSIVGSLLTLVVQSKQMIPVMPFSSLPRNAGSRAASLVTAAPGCSLFRGHDAEAGWVGIKC